MNDSVQAQQVAENPEAITPEPEKLIPQHVVDKSVITAKMMGREQGKREALAQMQAQQQAQQMQQQQAAPPGAPIDPALQNSIQAEVRKSNEQLMANMYAQNVASNFHAKAQAGLEKYPDLLDKIEDLGLPQIPQIIDLLAGSDNMADVINELHANPHKMSGMLNVPPNTARLQMQRLAGSIKANQDGMQRQFSKEPISQEQPSIIKGGNDANNLGKYDSEYFKSKSRR